ncbi:MAG: FtsX-like permease family protein [Gammaproteobacteria bacterium]|nr:FtsX-like permease family protein [Gammaproteobacteria bacterium]
MSLSIRPLLSSLLRSRTGAILVALQITIALAVMVNAIWIVSQRITEIEKPTGIDDRNMFVVAVAGLTSHFDLSSALAQDQDYLRSLPGVVAATATESVPLSGDGQSTELWVQPGQRGHSVDAGEMQLDTHGLKLLGTSLLSGRNFRPEEIQHFIPGQLDLTPAVAIVTRSLANALYPGESALGKALYEGGDKPVTIVGITRDFMGPVGLGYPQYMEVIYPQVPGAFGSYFLLVRTLPGRVDATMRVAGQHLATSNLDRVIFFTKSLAVLHRRMIAQNRNMAIFLATVTGLILGITCLGIFGLATYNVSTRTKQIGTRRAVGARKRDIIAYFMVENALILSTGVVAGCALALAMGYWLSVQYDLPRLDLYYLIGGVLFLWIVGQLAAWQPARRAASVSPSVATRTV